MKNVSNTKASIFFTVKLDKTAIEQAEEQINLLQQILLEQETTFGGNNL